MTAPPDLEQLLPAFCEELWAELESERPLSPAIRYRWQGAMQALSGVFGETAVQRQLTRLWRERLGDIDEALEQQLQHFEIPPQSRAAPVYPSSESAQS